MTSLAAYIAVLSIVGPAVEPWSAALNYAHMRESRCGRDPRCLPGRVGPAGERGAYQVTPPFVAEVRRISGFTIDPHDDASCRRGAGIWLDYWGPRVGLTPSSPAEQVYELYRRGPSGYRRWIKSTERMPR